MKSMVAITLLGLMSTSALADTGEDAAWKSLRYGEGYELKERHAAAQPKGEAEPAIEVKSPTESAMSNVVRAKMGDVEVCWLKQPAKVRVASSATMHLVIETGQVTAVRIDGALPAPVASCITAATNRWAFPVVDGRAEVEHPITFHTR